MPWEVVVTDWDSNTIEKECQHFTSVEMASQYAAQVKRTNPPKSRVTYILPIDKITKVAPKQPIIQVPEEKVSEGDKTHTWAPSKKFPDRENCCKCGVRRRADRQNLACTRP